ncbi:MFS transporter [Streptomyces cellulosae]|uniref:MFS transporter n=1 Tax=Streptomyces cellulosae TaxID=1968 RepID=UPI0005699306|nr:MFS transporter [Streptomyces cellulosae]
MIDVHGEGDHRLRPAMTLAAVCLAVLVLPASLTGTSVALPTIGADLGSGLEPLQWIVNAYNLTFASFMLALGSLADIVGRKRMFVFGSLLFTACSLVAALAGDVILLDVARGLSGVGAAASMTSGAALLATTFQGPALGRAFALLGSAAGIGLALGPSTAGALVNGFGWRAVFVSYVVIGVLVLLAVPFIKESKDPDAKGVDWAGAGTFSASLFLLTLAMVEGPQLGWSSGAVLAMFAGFAVLLVVFVIIEGRQERPMFDVSLFKQVRFLAFCLLPVAIAFGFVSLLVLLPSYLTGVNGVSAGEAGLTMLLLSGPVFVVPLLAAKLVAAVGNRVVLSLSLLLIGAGAAWLTVIHPGIGMGGLAGPLLLIGTGMGTSAGLIDGLAVSSVKPERAGMAAGMFNTMRLAGETIAIAAMGAMLLSLTRSQLTDTAARYPDAGSASELANNLVGGDLAGVGATLPAGRRGDLLDVLGQGYTDAFTTVLWVIAGICVVGTVIVYVMLSERRPAPVSETPETAPEPTPAA